MANEHEQDKEQAKVSAEGEALGEENRDVRLAPEDEQKKFENEGLGGYGSDAGDPAEESD